MHTTLCSILSSAAPDGSTPLDLEALAETEDGRLDGRSPRVDRDGTGREAEERDPDVRAANDADITSISSVAQVLRATTRLKDRASCLNNDPYSNGELPCWCLHGHP